MQMLDEQAVEFCSQDDLQNIIQQIGDLGFSEDRSKIRIVVAMSGGVDSSVVAALLKECGYDVVGITLQLYDHGMALAKKGACCAGQDIYDAKRVADKIGIPHFVLDYESRFRQSVIDDFAESYLAGTTPVPCIKCNQEVKFKDLLETAKEFGAMALATGHYINRKEQAGKGVLYPAFDKNRDQSYFLFATTQDQADFLRFPLGNLPKAITRQLAQYYGLEVSDKPDSQDICFVPDGSYAKVIEKIRPNASKPGDIIHIDQIDQKNPEILGHHKGLIHYTVGQRRGLGIALGTPLFVVKLDTHNNRLIVGSEEKLHKYEFLIRDINWLGYPVRGQAISTQEKSDDSCIMVKVRSTRPPKKGHIIWENNCNQAKIILQEPEKAIAPGQAAVCYDPKTNQLLGGGWIV